MIVRYYRIGGRGVPGDGETFELDDDGTLTAWRTVAAGAVGRLAGKVEPDVLATTIALANAAATTPPPTVAQPSDRPYEQVELPSAAAHTAHLGLRDSLVAGEVDAAAPPEDDAARDPWAALARHCRRLLDAAVEHPVAAIALESVAGSAKARLAHRGEEPVTLDLTGLRPRAVLHTERGEPVDEWVGQTPSRRTSSLVDMVVAGPGWHHDVVAEHGFAPGPGETVTLAVDFTIVAPLAPVPVQVRTG
ncbi:MAG: hypothetical protein ACJ73S_27735 [Mycobacteriales bacterium]